MPDSSADVLAVRDFIARAWLAGDVPGTLGGITLRPHQRDAAARLRTLLRRGGALLADPVGLGKTYTALAATRDARQLLIVAPAALRPMWLQALKATGRTADFASYESLSRGRMPASVPDAVIADEAHHLRNPGTIRYGVMARLCTRARALLLSATPVHNRADDLRAQLALFLGGRAWALDDDTLATYVVKREHIAPTDGDQPDHLPTVHGIHWYTTGEDDRVPSAIMALPPPLRPEDGGDGGSLLALSLVRQWASSRAALMGALRSRLAQAEALKAAFMGGRYPTRAQLRSWCYADGVLQLAFPQLASDVPAPDCATLVNEAETHMVAVRTLLRGLADIPDPDDRRAAALRDVLDRHPHAQVVVFAEFAATVKALYTRLLPLGGVAMLTGRGGQVAGGAVTRAELLEQFSPGAGHPVPAARRVRLLITTDLFSEGVNLQRASVVVHADLPWSPARAEQRVGRVRRMGSAHPDVFVYGLRPPAPADHLLQLEARLRRKVAAAAHLVGVEGTIMPRLFTAPVAVVAAPHAAAAELSQLLEPWLCAEPAALLAGPLVAGAVATTDGFLAVVDWGDGPRLVAGLPTQNGAPPPRAASRISTAPDDLRDAVRACGREPARVPDYERQATLQRLTEWCECRRTMAPLARHAESSPTRQKLIRRIDGITSSAPRHLRARYLAIARDARRAATATLSVGAEEVLRELMESELPDPAWLNAVRTFVELHARDAAPSGVQVYAVLLLVPTSLAPVAGRP
jgi:hypothetical protein